MVPHEQWCWEDMEKSLCYHTFAKYARFNRFCWRLKKGPCFHCSRACHGLFIYPNQLNWNIWKCKPALTVKSPSLYGQPHQVHQHGIVSRKWSIPVGEINTTLEYSEPTTLYEMQLYIILYIYIYYNTFIWIRCVPHKGLYLGGELGKLLRRM